MIFDVEYFVNLVGNYSYQFIYRCQRWLYEFQEMPYSDTEMLFSAMPIIVFITYVIFSVLFLWLLYKVLTFVINLFGGN